MKVFPKVFGIGLSGTGTRSLIGALELLNYKAKHYPTSLEDFDRYAALADIPVSSRYRFLDAMYPGAKFILTTRPLELWLKNRAHKNADERRQSLWKYEARFEVFGRLTMEYDEAYLTERFLAFHAEVREYFKDRSDYLEMDLTAGDGWEKLCPFLGRQIPDKPFPWKRTNYEDGSGQLSDLSGTSR